MIIDWFTVGAQALNFVILVWLMKRFLYKPIVAAIDAREKRIAAELADADAKKAEAKAERDEFQQKNDDFEQQRKSLLSKATADANAERLRLLGEARDAAEAESTKREERLRDEARDLERSIGRRAQQEVFAIARKALTDLATASLEERMTDVFVRRLHELDGEAKSRLGEALKASSVPAVVRSAFELPEPRRAALRDALNRTFSADVPVQFEVAPELVSGIEFATNGQKLAWSIADYLSSLQKGVGELLSQQKAPARQNVPQQAPASKGEVSEHA